LLLAAGELLRHVTRAVGEIDALESGSNALASLSARHPHI
jgi:hypothetical protein